MANFAGTLRRFGQSYEIHRRENGSFVKGSYVRSDTVHVSKKNVGVVQPIKPEELQKLPDGLRKRAEFKLHTTDRLKIGSTDSEEGFEPDHIRITRGGDFYEAYALSDWNVHGNFYKYALVKVLQNAT